MFMKKKMNKSLTDEQLKRSETEKYIYYEPFEVILIALDQMCISLFLHSYLTIFDLTQILNSLNYLLNTLRTGSIINFPYPVNSLLISVS